MMFREDKNKELRMVEGIYSFINEAELTGDNLKYNKLYNKIAWSHNLSQRLYFWLKFGGERKLREPFLSELTRETGKQVRSRTGTDSLNKLSIGYLLNS